MAASEAPASGPTPRRSRLWMALLGVLLLFEGGVARQPAVRQRVLYDDISRVEKYLIAPAAAPEVVVFGNSRVLLGLDERALADQAGVPRDKVLKLAWRGAGASEYLPLYRRHREQLRHARCVIIGIEDWDTAYSTWLRPGDVYYATLAERLTACDWRYLPVSLSTWACQSFYMARPVLVYLGREARARVRGRHFSDAPTAQQLRDSGLFNERDAKLETIWLQQGEAAAHAAYPDRKIFQLTEADHLRMHCDSLPRVTAGGWRQVQRLAQMCLDDGATVLIVRPPLGDRYLRELGELYPQYARAFEQLVPQMQAWAATTGGRAEVRVYGSATATGLPPHSLYDYGHFSPQGRTFFTDALADWVRAQPAREGSP